MSDKMHYRDRVDVRFDDRFRFNRHREGAEKNGRENCVEHAGGEISILNHMCTSRSSSECVYYVTRARVSTIEERKENTLECFFLWGIFQFEIFISEHNEHFAY